MAAHQYWQLVALAPYGITGLELSEVHLLSGSTRVDTTATFSSSVPPDTGSLASLSDDNLLTVATWKPAAVKTLTLSWDFGVGGADVTDIRLGSALDPAKFLMSARLEYADTLGTWTNYFAVTNLVPAVLNGISWPGIRSKTVSVSRGIWNVMDLPSGIALDTTRRLGRKIAGGALRFIRGVSQAPSGIRQFEVAITGTDVYVQIGVGTMALGSSAGPPYTGAGNWIIALDTGQKGNNNVLSAYTTAIPALTVIGVVVDSATGSLTFYKNGASLGVAFTGISADIYPLWGASNSSNESVGTLRTAGFTYPVAGALPWDATQVVATVPVAKTSQELASVPTQVSIVMPYGQPRGVISTALPSGISIVIPYGQQRVSPVFRGRDNFTLLGYGRNVGRIAGTVKEKASPDSPVYRKVRLIRELDGMLLREMWSDRVTGAFQFDYVDETAAYTVLSYDHTGAFRAVVASGLSLASGGVTLITVSEIPPLLLRVRSAGALSEGGSVVSQSATTPICMAGDLLVAAVMYRTASVAPAGWVQVSSSGQATGSSFTQETCVYTRVATAAEPVTYTFSQSGGGRLHVHMIALTSPSGTPVFNSEYKATKNNSPDVAIDIPGGFAPSTEKTILALGVASTLTAFSPVTVFNTPWANEPRVNTGETRLAIATRRFGGLDAVTGSAQFSLGSVGGALTANTVFFTDP